MKARHLPVIAILTMLSACREADSVVLLNVDVAGAVPPVGALRVTLSLPTAHDIRTFPAPSGQGAVKFPASLVLVIPRSRSGRLDLVVEAVDASYKTVASGPAQVAIVVGGQARQSVILSVGAMLCGNGVVDPGEGCDDGNLASFDGCSFQCKPERTLSDAGSSQSTDAGFVRDAGEDAAQATDATSDIPQGLPDSVAEAPGGLDLEDRPGAWEAGGADGMIGTGGAMATDGPTIDTGSTATGGVVGTGGTLATGGGTGSGGHSTTGGITGSGGITSAGGITGSGGVTASTGGSPGDANAGGGGTEAGGSSGGIIGSGGLNGSGGQGGTGGTAGTGGGSGGTQAGIPGQSCSALPSNCGPYVNESCCYSLLVPGGAFYRSYDGIDFTDTGFPATVAAFALDRYEVTVGRFRAFVSAGKGTKKAPPAANAGVHPLVQGSGWDAAWNSELVADTASLKSAISCDVTHATWTDNVGANENRPINCLTWYEAFAFCAWDGGRLPTDAELNFAESGGSEQRYYPWSSPANSTKIDGSYVASSGYATTTVVVGSKSPKGDGRWGHADLGGNLWEVALDYFASPYAQNVCTNCANLSPTSGRTARGGGFLDVPRSADRSIARPTYRNYDVGFRCARASQ